MVYTEFDTAHDGLFLGLFSLTVVGLPLLALFSWIDDSVAKDHATEEGDEIVGRCETCGDLVRSDHAYRPFIEEVGREVLVCPFGYSNLGEGPYRADEREREKAIRAIETPMLIKRLS